MKRLGALGLAFWCAGAVVMGGAVLAPDVAFAAGSGYTPGSPTVGGSATGLPGTVISTTTVQPSGGTGTGAIGSVSIAVTVPTGTFANPTQVVITDATNSQVPPSNGGSVVATFGVGFFVNGTKVTGTFPAVTITVSSSSIQAGATVYVVSGGQLIALTGASVKNGSATFTVTSDPTIEVVAAVATTTSISGATAAVTGKPFALEEIVAGSLVALGGIGLLLLFRRQRAA